MSYKLVLPEEINENFIKNIGSEWMLVTAGNKEKYNMMTASWGFAGVMWGFPCAITAVRPQRYTAEFIEKEKFFTLSFYGDDKSLHGICGRKSGRDIDKTKETGLVPVFDSETGAPYFDKARLVLVCEKVYEQTLKEELFIDKSILDSAYPNKDFHKMYYGKIVKALVKE